MVEPVRRGRSRRRREESIFPTAPRQATAPQRLLGRRDHRVLRKEKDRAGAANGYKSCGLKPADFQVPYPKSRAFLCCCARCQEQQFTAADLDVDAVKAEAAEQEQEEKEPAFHCIA